MLQVDSSFPLQEEAYHVILYATEPCDNATNAFRTMLSKMPQSPDRQVHDEHPSFQSTPTSIMK